jgi:hypothetical protein
MIFSIQTSTGIHQPNQELANGGRGDREKYSKVPIFRRGGGAVPLMLAPVQMKIGWHARPPEALGSLGFLGREMGGGPAEERTGGLLWILRGGSAGGKRVLF